MGRLSSAVGRLMAALIKPEHGQAQVYVDDLLLLARGTQEERWSMVSLLLYTLRALGVQVSLRKGERGEQIKWIGVVINLDWVNTPKGERKLVYAIPKNMICEIKETLESWEGKGMIGLRELRTLTGKLSWVAGIVTRMRWAVSVLYSVIASMEEDIRTNSEPLRAARREDKREKPYLVAVKRLEIARRWLLAVMRDPDRMLIRTEELEEPPLEWAIISDACPTGYGAVLAKVVPGAQNLQPVAYEAKFTEADAKLLEVKWGEASSQGPLEALGLWRAMKTWATRIQGKGVLVRSDSAVTLATTDKGASGLWLWTSWAASSQSWQRSLGCRPWRHSTWRANWTLRQTGCRGQGNGARKYQQPWDRSGSESWALSATTTLRLPHRGDPMCGKTVHTPGPFSAACKAVGEKTDQPWGEKRRVQEPGEGRPVIIESWVRKASSLMSFLLTSLPLFPPPFAQVVPSLLFAAAVLQAELKMTGPVAVSEPWISQPMTAKDWEIQTAPLESILILAWLASLGLAFLGGIWCSLSCMPRLRQVKQKIGGCQKDLGQWWQWAVEFHKEIWEDEMKDQAGVGVGLPLSPARPPTTIATSPTTGDSAKTSWATEESVESLEVISSRRGSTRRQRSPRGSNEERRPRTSESGQWQKVPEPKRMGGAILQRMNEAASPWKKKWSRLTVMNRKSTTGTPGIQRGPTWTRRLSWRKTLASWWRPRRISRRGSSHSTRCRQGTPREERSWRWWRISLG